jgi:hypothetical protein
LAELTKESSWRDALRLRRWDDAAKRPDLERPDPAELLAIVRPLALRPR